MAALWNNRDPAASPGPQGQLRAEREAGMDIRALAHTLQCACRRRALTAMRFHLLCIHVTP